MAGNAITSKVLLSSATVMVGPQADLLKFMPETHSIGLVKNFTMSGDPEFKELTQDITNDVVMSIKTNDGTRMSAEVYEYTLRNISYGLGIDASGVEFDPIENTFVTSAAPSGTSVPVTVPSGETLDISAGDFVYIQDGIDDKVHIAKVASVLTNILTLEAKYAIPEAVSFAAACRVGKVRKVGIGAQTPQGTMAAKVVGVLPEDKTPITLYFPKVKVTRGLSLSFSTENFANMPFEFTPLVQTASDPLWSEFGTDKVVYFGR